MSKTIDERVVSMEFDNSRFEKNVAQSMSTLQKLKNALRLDKSVDSFKAIDSAAKNVSFSGIISGLSSVNNSFNATQAIAIGALMEIGRKAANAGEKIVRSLTIDQVSSGWDKYQAKASSVQALINATGKSEEVINKQLQKLMWYSDQTSYSFSDMVSALSQMVIAGGDMETVVPVIEGIANSVAYAGKGATEFTISMRNLVQSYQQGFLNYADFKSLDLQGTTSVALKQMLIDVGNEMGTIKKNVKDGTVTLENFNTTLASKWADREVMEEAFRRFAEYTVAVQNAVGNGEFETAEDAMEALAGEYSEIAERAFKAGQESKSFADSINATKDAVSTGWMRIFETIFGGYTESKKLWTGVTSELWEIFASGFDNKVDFLESALGPIKDQFDSIIDSFNENDVSADGFLKHVKDSIADLNPEIAETIGKLSDFGEIIRESKISGKELSSIVSNFALSEDAVNSATQMTKNRFTEYADIVDNLIYSGTQLSEDVFTELRNSEYDTAIVQKLYNAALERMDEDGTYAALSMRDLGDTVEDAAVKSKWQERQLAKTRLELMAFAESIKNMPIEEYERLLDPKVTGREFIAGSILNTLGTLTNVLGAVKAAFADAFDFDALGLRMRLAKLEAFTSKIKDYFKIVTNPRTGEIVKMGEGADKLRRTFQGLFSGVKFVMDGFKGLWHIGSNLVSKVFGGLNVDVLELTARFGDSITRFVEWTEEAEVVKGIVETVGELFDMASTQVKEWVDAFRRIPLVRSAMEQLKLTDWFTKIQSFSLRDWSKNLVADIKYGLTDGIKSIPNTIRELYNQLVETFRSKTKDWTSVGSDIVNGVSSGIVSSTSALWPSIQAIGTVAKSYLKKINWEDVIAGGSVIGLTYAVKKISDALDLFSKPASALTDLLVSSKKAADNVSDVLSTTKNTIKAFQKNLNGTDFKGITRGIREIAMAMLLLAGSFALIAWATKDMDTRAWLKAAGTLVGLAAILGVLAAAMAQFGKGTSVFLKKDSVAISTNILAIVGIAVSIGILAVAMAKLAGTEASLTRGAKALGVITACLAGIIAVLGLVSRTSVLFNQNGIYAKGLSDNVSKLGTAMLKISIAMVAMAGVMKIVGTLSEGEIKKGIAFASGFTVFLTVMAGVSRLLGASYANQFASGLLKLTIVMGLLVGVMKLVSLLKAQEAVKGALFMGGFVAFVALMGKASNAWSESQENKFVRQLIGLTVSMTLLAGVCKLVHYLSLGDILSGALFVSGFVLLMKALVKVTKIGENEKIANLSLTLLGFSAAIAILAGVSWLLGRMDIVGLLKGILVVGLLSLVIDGMIVATKHAKDVKGSMVGLAVAIGAMAASIAALALLAHYNVDLMPAVKVLSIAMTAFALMEYSLGKMGNIEGKTLGALGMLMGAIIIITSMIALLAAISPDSKKTLAAAGSISLVLMAMVGALKLLNGYDRLTKGAIKAIGAMTAVVAALSVALAVIGRFSDGNAIKNAAAISLLLTALVASVKMASDVDGLSRKALLSLAVMGGFVAVIALLMPTLSRADPKNAIANASAIGILLIALSSSLRIASGASGIGQKAILAIGVMTAVTIAIAGILWHLQTMDPKNAITNAIALGVLVNALAAATVMLSLAKGISAEAIAGAGVLSLVIALLANTLPMLNEVNPDGLLTKTTALSELLLALSASMILLSVAGKGGVAVFEGAAAVLAFVAAIGAIMAGIGYLMQKDKFADLDDFVKKAIPVLEAVGQGIGEFIGGLAGGLISGFNTAVLDGLSDAIDALKELVDKASGFSDTGIDNIGTLAATVAAIVGTNLLSDIDSFLFGWTRRGKSADSNAMVQTITQFGNAIVALNGVLSGADLDTERIQLAVDCGKILTEFQNSLSATNGIIQFFTGQKDLGKFGSNIAKFAGGLVQLSYGMDKVELNNVAKAVTIGTLLSELQNGLAASGVIPYFIGMKSLGTFGSNIQAFGEAIAAFAETVSSVNLDLELVSKAAMIGYVLSALQSSLPEQSSLWDKWFGSGDNSMKTFSKGFAAFGSGIADMATAMEGTDLSNVSAAADACAALSTIPNNIKDFDASSISNFQSVIDGLAKISLEGFVEAFGARNTQAAMNSVSDFLHSISEIFSTGALEIQEASAAIPEAMTDGMESASEIVESPIVDILSKAKETLGEQVANFTENGAELMASYASGIDLNASAPVESINNMISSVRDALASDVSDRSEILANDIASSFASKIDTDSENVKESVSGMLSEIGTMFDESDVTNQATNLGEKIGNGFVAGIKGKQKLALNAAKGLVSQAKEGLSSGKLYDSGRAEGQYLGQGFIEGIDDYLSEVYEAAKALGEKAVSGLHDGAENGSPSIAGRRNGNWLGQGFILGVRDTAHDVVSAAFELGDRGVDAIAASLKKIQGIASGELDLTPVVTPVVDMSEISQIANDISSLLDINISVSLEKLPTNVKMEPVENKVQAAAPANVTFNQYNTSPKALSRIEIYRQTRNQFSAIERLVGV